jgi:hypothetical protein
MRIEEPTRESVLHVITNMRESDMREFLAVSHMTDRRTLSHVLLDRYERHPDVIVAWNDQEPVAVGAMLETRPKVATLMFFATDKFETIAAPLTRFIRQRLFARCKNVGVHRIECLSIEGYPEAHRWIKALGLSQEAVMHGFGREGETFYQFAWVKENVRSPGA